MLCISIRADQARHGRNCSTSSEISSKLFRSVGMDSAVGKEGDKAFDEAVSLVQQQISTYKERTNQRFQELEELVGLAAQKMEILREKMKAEKKGEARFVNSGVKPRSSGHDLLKSLHYIESDVPKFDELQGEDKADWHSEEIICTALGLEDFFQPKKNSEQGNSSGAKELEYTSDFRITPKKIESNGKEELDEPIESEDLEFLMPKDLIASTELDELRLQPAPCLISKFQDVEEKPLPILINMRLLIEKASWRDNPIAAKFSELEEKSSHLHKNKMIIFDPGGYVYPITTVNGIQGVGEESNEVVYENNHHMKQPTGVIHMFKEMTRNKFLAIKQLLKVLPYEVSRIKVTIHIFDPGGNQNTSYKVETVMHTALLHKYPYLAVEQGRRNIHEDMNDFKGEGLSGTALVPDY